MIHATQLTLHPSPPNTNPRHLTLLGFFLSFSLPDLTRPLELLTLNLLKTDMFHLQPRNRSQHLLPQRRNTLNKLIRLLGLEMRLHTFPANSEEVGESLPTRTLLVRQLTRPVNMPH